MDKHVELAQDFGYRVGKLPLFLFGSAFQGPFKSVLIWDGIEERLYRRLALWRTI